MTWYPPPATCVRRAWLTLGATGQTIDLENRAGGWFCTELNLGYPNVREVVSNRPDQDGIDDRTQYFGARAVTANITALAGAGARIDDVADNFAPFMQPSLRPVLHVILDRPGAAERTMTVRAAGYGYQIAGDNQRDIQLAWVASDPYLYDPTVQTATAWGGSTTAQGRTYPLTFNRTYPAGGGTSTTGVISSAGDLPVQPLLRIYGPITAPQVNFVSYTGGVRTGPGGRVAFVSGFVIGAGDWVDVDTDNKTAFQTGDPTRSVFNQLNFATIVWPVLPVLPSTTNMVLSGSGVTSAVTQVQAIWHDGYLS